MEVITKGAENTKKHGQSLGDQLISKNREIDSLSTATIITLTGELGSGKTTFVQGFAQALGIPHRVLSPTFLLVKQYALSNSSFTKFFHIDLYSITSLDKVKDLGLNEILENTENIVVIEWPEKIMDLLPNKRIDISFETVSEMKRKILITDNTN